MRKFCGTLVAALVWFAAVANAETEHTAPPLVLIDNPSQPGQLILTGWRTVQNSFDETDFEWSPVSPHWADKGALIVGANEFAPELTAAALNSARNYGFRSPEVVASKAIEEAKRNAPTDRSAAILIQGLRNGRQSKMIAWVWWHDWDDAWDGPVSGIHAFIAENDAFEALGGYALISATFHGATPPPDFSPMAAGKLNSNKQVEFLASYADTWFTNQNAYGSAETMLWLRGLAITNGVGVP